jgi:hypothetical protein
MNGEVDKSGTSVGFVMLIGVVCVIGGVSFIDSSNSTETLLKERDTQIRQLQQQNNQCRYEYQGYRDGRR